jgi:glycosyltransferase involved in cell wall biosynthesis
VFVGEGHEPKGPAQKYARTNKLNLTRVHFLGKQSYTKTLSLIESAQILLQPSLNESFSNVVLEAIQRDTPVIAHCSSAGPEGILESCPDAGYLADMQSVTELSQKIRLMILNPTSADTKVTNKIVSEKYSSSNTVTEICDKFQQWGLDL